MVGRITLCTIVLAAVAPAIAWGGGFATAGVSPPPADTKPGAPWNAKLTILQHGRTPLDNVKPAVIIRPAGGGTARTFRAKPTGEPGEYVARVVFPTAGRWSYVVDDGFSARHDFAPVTIGGAGAGAPTPAAARDGAPPANPVDGGGIDVWLALGLAAAAGVLAGLATLAFRRRRGSGPTAVAGG
jgi:hypothetical protein